MHGQKDFVVDINTQVKQYFLVNKSQYALLMEILVLLKIENSLLNGYLITFLIIKWEPNYSFSFKSNVRKNILMIE